MQPIRAARAEDAATLTRIALAAKRHGGYAETDLERWREELTIPPSLLQTQPAWVWDESGRILGFLALLREGRHCELAHLWVLPEAMRRGIGRVLLKRALEYASEHHIHALTIDADPQAEAFYVRCGAAVRIGAVSAPTDEEPARTRPQLLIFAE